NRKTDPTFLMVNAFPEWKVATSLDPAALEARPTMHGFLAPNYDVMADAPVEMGDYAEKNFTVKGVPLKVVLYGDYSQVDQDKLTGYCKRVAETETAFMGDIPFKRYVFMFRSSGNNGRGAGGLEHLGSTEITLRGIIDDRVRSVIAHEFFHLWNVKRARPRVLGPFDYTGPNHTRNLWWSEGVTSYYGDLLSRRGGLNTDDEYLNHLGATIGQLQNTPARLKVTADDSSYKVWDGGGSQGYGQLSYYTKGELIGLCLDLKIREVTGNRHSLDDVMHALYLQCGRGEKPGFDEDDIKKTANRVAGTDLSSFYDLLARSTEEMPFTECLAYAGLTLTKSETPTLTPNPGAAFFPDMPAGGLRVRFVSAGGAAEMAGLKADDLIVTVDGKPALDPDGTLRRNPRTDTPYELVVERDGQKQNITFKVGVNRTYPFVLKPDAGATPRQVHLRESWLSGKS
ncbi:MAG TPA: hypothetical protein VKU00_16720, partial [Chthonomonadaceae bacterium]|nr:hypothetical protein [Chthonomonadaceae bacterium]